MEQVAEALVNISDSTRTDCELIIFIMNTPRRRTARYQVCHSGLSGIVPAMSSHKKDSRQAGMTESTIIIRTLKQSFEEFL
jgi:hypothetical protein